MSEAEGQVIDESIYQDRKAYCPRCLTLTKRMDRQTLSWAQMYDMWCPACETRWYFTRLLTPEERQARLEDKLSE